LPAARPKAKRKTMSSRPTQNRLLGIGLRVSAATAFGLMAATIKLAYAGGVSAIEVAFYRSAFALPTIRLWMAATGSLMAWRSERPLAHVWRASIGLTAMVLNFTALHYLPLAEATTIGFAAPLFAVILSALVLKEKVGRHRWSAVAIGFAGVLLVMRPDGGQLPIAGLLIALGGAFMTSVVIITLRQIGRTESTATIVLWFTTLSTLGLATTLPWTAQGHGGTIWLLLLAIGALGGAGQILMTASLRFAPVSTVVPFDYAQLLWAVLLGWLLFATRPAPTTWIGAAIIVGSGLYTLHRERVLGQVKAEPAPAV
jgi:drug/metabolite transporter (DMT)-like permease